MKIFHVLQLVNRFTHWYISMKVKLHSDCRQIWFEPDSFLNLGFSGLTVNGDVALFRLLQQWHQSKGDVQHVGAASWHRATLPTRWWANEVLSSSSESVLFWFHLLQYSPAPRLQQLYQVARRVLDYVDWHHNSVWSCSHLSKCHL